MYQRCRSTDSSYTVYNHPLPVTAQFNIIIKVILSVIAGLFILVPLCYLPAAFVTFLVKERTSKSKHLQIVSGVSPRLYWIANYIWDYLLYSILMLSIILALYMYSQTISSTFLSSSSSTLAVFLFLATFGASVLPLSYLYSFFFDNYSTAQISITVIHFATGFIFVISYYITVRFSSQLHSTIYSYSFFRNSISVP